MANPLVAVHVSEPRLLEVRPHFACVEVLVQPSGMRLRVSLMNFSSCLKPWYGLYLHAYLGNQVFEYSNRVGFKASTEDSEDCVRYLRRMVHTELFKNRLVLPLLERMRSAT